MGVLLSLELELTSMEVPRVADLGGAGQRLEGDCFVPSGGLVLSQSCVHIPCRKIKHGMTPNPNHSRIWSSWTSPQPSVHVSQAGLASHLAASALAAGSRRPFGHRFFARALPGVVDSSPSGDSASPGSLTLVLSLGSSLSSSCSSQTPDFWRAEQGCLTSEDASAVRV